MIQSLAIDLSLLLSIATCGVASVPPWHVKPHLHGIFLDLTMVTAQWTEGEWRRDLQSMMDVGIQFFVLHHVASGSAQISDACPLGTYAAYFPVNGNASGIAARCFSQVGSNASGGTVGVLLRAAASVGIRVHLGLAAQMHLKTPSGENALYVNSTVLSAFQQLQSSVARELWRAFGAGGVIDGFYTYIEQPQNYASFLPHWLPMAQHYLQPLARYIKRELPMGGGWLWGSPPAAASAAEGSQRWPTAHHLLVWSSPDAVGNYTR
jgi:hypothetical protein